MKKLYIIVVLLIVALILTGCARAQLKRELEETQRKRIESWEYEVEIYLQYKDSEKPGDQEFADEAKTKANEVAAAYNEDMMKFGNLWGETFSEGIYAVIEPIE